MANTPEPDPCAGDPDCQQALAELYTYLDGELTVHRRTIIRTHLDRCPPCGDRYVFETELRQVISMRCQERVPDALRLRIAEAIRNEMGR
ncbi:MAG: mycothiol system anti-sigma-R factor [Acidimicrobiales bacterium]